MDKRYSFVFFIFLFLMQLCYSIEYTWTLTNGIVLSNSDNFNKIFSLPGKYILILIASIPEIGLQSSRDTTFYVAYDGKPYCVDGNNWLISNDIENPILSSNNHCYFPDGFNRIYCCGMGKFCDTSKDSNGICSDLINSEYISCVDYKTSESCNNDNYGIAEYSIEQKVGNENFCGSIINITTDGDLVYGTGCSCFWNNEEGICISKWNESVYNSTDGSITSSGSCSLSTTKIIGDCSKDEYRIEYLSGNWTGNSPRPSTCPIFSERRIPCGGVVSLDFFSWYSFLIAFILIFIVYFIFFLRKKKNK